MLRAQAWCALAACCALAASVGHPTPGLAALVVVAGLLAIAAVAISHRHGTRGTMSLPGQRRHVAAAAPAALPFARRAQPRTTRAP